MARKRSSGKTKEGTRLRTDSDPLEQVFRDLETGWPIGYVTGGAGADMTRAHLGIVGLKRLIIALFAELRDLQPVWWELAASLGYVRRDGQNFWGLGFIRTKGKSKPLVLDTPARAARRKKYVEVLLNEDWLPPATAIVDAMVTLRKGIWPRLGGFAEWKFTELEMAIIEGIRAAAAVKAAFDNSEAPSNDAVSSLKAALLSIKSERARKIHKRASSKGGSAKRQSAAAKEIDVISKLGAWITAHPKSTSPRGVASTIARQLKCGEGQVKNLVKKSWPLVRGLRKVGGADSNADAIRTIADLFALLPDGTAKDERAKKLLLDTGIDIKQSLASMAKRDHLAT